MSSELRQRIFTIFYMKDKVAIFIVAALLFGYSETYGTPISFKKGRLSAVSKRTDGEKTRRLARRVRIRRLIGLSYRTRGREIEIGLSLTGRVRVNWGEAPADVKWNLPHRIYIDLEPCIPVKKLRYRAISIGGRIVRKIRIGRNTLVKTRVVIEVTEKVPFRVKVLGRKIIVLLSSDGGTKVREEEKGGEKEGEGSRGTEPKGANYLRKGAAPTKEQGNRASARKVRAKKEVPLRLPFPFRVRRVAIDAGHGGREEGAIGKKFGLKEKWLTLKIARYTVKFLKAKGIDAFLVRRGDETLSLDQRVQRIKKSGADILISIHINSSYSSYLRGISTYFLLWSPDLDSMRMLSHNPLLARENQGVHPKQFSDVGSVLNGLQFQSNLIISKILARLVQESLIKNIEKVYPTVKDLGVKRGLFYLLFASNIPSILTEISFISNPKEEALLKRDSYLRAAARGIAAGVVRFVELTKRSKRER